MGVGKHTIQKTKKYTVHIKGTVTRSLHSLVKNATKNVGSPVGNTDMVDHTGSN